MSASAVARLTKEEVQKLSGFTFNELLGGGNGGGGAVYVGSYNGHPAAIKRFMRAAHALTHLANEVRLLSVVNHPNVVSALAYCDDPTCPAIIFPLFVPLEDKFQTITDDDDKMVVLRDTTRGVQALHHARHAHRDIKPENLLVEVNAETGKIERAVVCDLSLAVTIVDTEVRTSFVGTPIFSDPETHTGGVFKYHHEIYTLGVLFALIWGARYPKRDETIAALIESAPFPPPLRDLVQRMVGPGEARPSIDDVVAALGAL